MRISVKHYGRFEGGRFLPDAPDVLGKDLSTLQGKKGYAVFRVGRRRKSNNQNKYYWGVVIPLLCEFFGYDKEQMHSALCLEHLVVRTDDGRPPYIKSTRLAEWNTAEWENYMEYLRRWAVQNHGVYIPTPNEVDYDDLPEVAF